MSGRRSRAVPAVAALLVLAALAGACGGSSEPSVAPASPRPASAPPGSAGAGPSASVGVASPVDGLVVKLESEGLVRVTGFRLRTADGAELAFTMGATDNAVEFPPSHLAEHMTTASRVRVFFRDEAGERVVYRLEDAE